MKYRNHVIPKRHCPYCKAVISVTPRDHTIAAYYNACDAVDVRMREHLTECSDRQAAWRRRYYEGV